MMTAKFYYFLILILVILCLRAALAFADSSTRKEIRYVALGDSFTIGTGALPQNAWPNLLTEDLKAHHIAIRLIANPAQAGWTTQQVIEHELPIFVSSQPQFTTLLIGVNDWVQGVDGPTFRTRFQLILDQLLKYLPSQRILVVNIPDFSVSPNGRNYSNGRNISEGLSEFNRIIQEESSQRKVLVVDLFSASQKMKNHPELFSPDGLHPSATGYAFWEKVIFPQARDLLLIK